MKQSRFTPRCLTSLGLAAVLALCLTTTLRSQDAGDGILNAIRPQLKDPSKPFTLVIRLKAKDGSAEAFESAFAAAMKATRKEKGCLAYDLNRLADGSSEYVVYEKWASYDAIKTHIVTPYIVKLLGQLPQLTEGAPKIDILTPAAE